MARKETAAAPADFWAAFSARTSALANADAEFAQLARFWTATVRLGVGGPGGKRFKLRIQDGRIATLERWLGGIAVDLAIDAPEADWRALLAATPRPFYQDLYAAAIHHGFQVAGDAEHYCAYYPALRRLIELMRAAAGGDQAVPSVVRQSPEPAPEPQFDAAVGRYVRLPIAGVAQRLYFEESGTGDVGLLLQHTAGADGRQWRHLLEDPGLQAKFRMVAYDLPYHGKSIPPEGEQWWEQEYRLTREQLMAVPVALAAALGLERPVYMGSSIGGHLAIDLAIHRPQAFRAVVGLEASAYTPGGFVDEFHHPRVGNQFKAHLMFGMTSPTSPLAHRHETAWTYSQGAPPVFKGDLYYYSVDHDVRNTAATIDTSVCSVDILNGEYDWSGTPTAGAELAALIPGARYKTMPKLGHFPMCEDPARFLAEIKPVLDRIAG